MTAKLIEAFRPYFENRSQSKGDEYRAYCPLCEDPDTSGSPSASFNFEVDGWRCLGKCGRQGSIKNLYKHLKANGSLLGSLSKDSRLSEDLKPLPTPKQVKAWHKQLMKSLEHRRYLNVKRSISDDILRQYNIGWNGDRFTVPIYDLDGRLVNIRKYRPRMKAKVVSFAEGYGQARLYGYETLEANQKVYLSEGEMDRLCGLSKDLPFVSHTGGSGVFLAEWAIYFQDKDVVVVYDEDEAGDKGAAKVAQMLREVANSVSRLKLETGIKGGDTTDFFANGGTVEHFLELEQDARVLFKRESQHVAPTEGEAVSLEESQSAKYGGATLQLDVMVSGKVVPPYLVPRTLSASCQMDYGPSCASCPIMTLKGEKIMTFEPDDPRLLKYVDQGHKSRQIMHRDLLGARCQRNVTVEELDQYTIEELIVAPSVSHRTEEVETPINRTVLNIATYKTPINQPSRIICTQLEDPRQGRGILHGWNASPLGIDIDDFELTPELRERLKVFRNKAGQSPLDKCFEIAEDMAANVTKIYGRPLLHTAYDLIWHSPVGFSQHGSPVTKGWLEALIIGDTRTGKSECANRLIEHYGAGMARSCESMSFAGLVGGAQQVANKHWMVTWGLLPLNDRRLVFLDEMSGLFSGGGRESKGIIEGMSSIRSEGKAQITKVNINEETSARTRMVWASNPIDGVRLAGSPESALRALRSLVRSPEDIARFDFVMAVTNDEVSSSIINSPKHKQVKHVYTSELAHALVMWTWSRKADQVKWGPGAEDAVLRAAEDVGGRYVPDPPLIQAENVRLKIARLAVAFAARTFSTNKSGQMILVKVQHVDAAVEFLDMVYGSSAMGYAAHSRRILADRELARKSRAACRKFLRKNPDLTNVLYTVGAEHFTGRDLQDFGALDKDQADALVKRLQKWRMIERAPRKRWKLSPALMMLVQEMEVVGG